MPETFPKSHLAQFNVKYLQVKSNLILSSKTDNTITITTLTHHSHFFKGQNNAGIVERRRMRRNSEAKRARLESAKQPLFLTLFIFYS